MRIDLTRSVLIGLVLLQASSALPADAQPPLIPRSVLFSSPTRTAVQLSPEGKRITFIEIKGGERSLRFADVDAPGNSQAVVLEIDGVPIDCKWDATRGRLIVLLAVAGGRHLVCHNLKTGESIDLTPLEGIQARLEKISAQRPDEIVVGLNDREAGTHDLWKVDLATGQRTKLLETTGLVRVHLDAAFVPRVAERFVRGGGIEVLQRTDEEWNVLCTLEEDATNRARVRGGGVKGVVGVAADGKTLFLVDNARRDKSALQSLDLDSGEARVLAEDPAADIRPVTVVDRLTGEVLGVTSYFGQMRRHHLDAAVQADFEELERLVGSDVGVVNVSAADPAWLVVPMDGGALRFAVYHRQTRQLKRLFAMHGAIDPEELVQRSARVIEARDGLKLPCHLYLPAGSDRDRDGTPDAPLPTVLYVHGGPHIPNPWDSWFTNRNLQLLANRGYAVVNVDFRGAGGYGKEFLEKGYREWGGEIQRDILDIAEWAVAEGVAKQDRIAIWGWSFGGLSTNAALAFAPETFTCGISMYGLSDLEAFAKYARFGDPSGVKLRIGDVSTEEGQARLQAQSPIHAAERVVRPLLLTHGSKDRVALQSHSDRFVAALKKHGKDVTYIVYPDEPHDYRKAESWISFWAVAERFLHEHLGGRYEPFGNDLPAARFEVVEGRDLVPGLEEQLRAG